MTLSLQLPTAGGALETYRLAGGTPARPAAGTKFNRIAYSAAHVVADPRVTIDPWLSPPPSTGTSPSPTASTCGRWAWAWPRPWTRRSAAWPWTGPPRWS